MGHALEPEKAKLFAAVLFSDHEELGKALKLLTRKFGSIDYTYGPIPFVQSTYYNKEMGKGLHKAYYCFETLVDRDALARIKRSTNTLENKFTTDERRRVNIDPGYISRDKLILASTKDFFHRVYLRGGVFAEVTLHFRKGKYRYFSWTYPDYREPEFCSFLEKARARLVKQLRTLHSSETS